VNGRNQHGGPGTDAVIADAPPVVLVRYRPGVTGLTTCTVHLVSMRDGCQAGAVSTLCGTVLSLDEIETVTQDQGMPCAACLINQVICTTPAVEPPGGSPTSGRAGLTGAAPYHAWGWPVTYYHDQVRLSVDCDVSAIAIPISLSTEIICTLTHRYCAPAVLAHPCAPVHRIVLTGERYGVPLPWPHSAHQLTGAIMLPPTITTHGPITWITVPSKDSLQLSREIDVFAALRSALRDSSSG
jgi:hypothetical protein